MKIPEYRQDSQTPDPARVPSSLLHAGSEAAPPDLRPLSSALYQGAQLYQDKQEEEGRAWSASRLSEARLVWTQEMINRQNKAEPNAPEFTLNFIKDYDDYANKLIESAPTEHAKRYMTSRMNEFRVQIGDKAMEFEAKARIDYRTDQFKASIDNVRKLMNTDPSQFPEALAEVQAAIRSSEMDPVRKSALIEQAKNGIAEAAVWSRIQKSPSRFLEDIGFNATPGTKTRKTSGDLQGVTGDLAYDALPYERRVQMMSEAVKLKAQIDSDVIRGAEQERKRLEQEASKNLWSKWADKTLKRSDIEQVRPVLSPTEYHGFLKALEEKHEVKTDPTVMTEIIKLEAEGKWDAAVQRAFNAQKWGLMNTTDLASVVHRSRTMERQEGPKSPFERGRQYIVTSMDPGPLVQDPLGKQRMADAVDEFESWHNSQKEKPSHEDSLKMSKEIVGRYKFVTFSDKILALPEPRFGKLSRSMTDPEIVKSAAHTAIAETKRRLENKEITQPEHDRELALINRWIKAADGRR